MDVIDIASSGPAKIVEWYDGAPLKIQINGGDPTTMVLAFAEDYAKEPILEFFPDASGLIRASAEDHAAVIEDATLVFTLWTYDAVTDEWLPLKRGSATKLPTVQATKKPQPATAYTSQGGEPYTSQIGAIYTA